jgi:hypothetical protein
MDGENNDKHNYDSSSATTASHRPKLVISPAPVEKDYTYSQEKPHAVTTLSTGEEYEYDENGNIFCRLEKGPNDQFQTYAQQWYDVDNRMSGMGLRSGSCEGDLYEIWIFEYDGDGNRIQQLSFMGDYVPGVSIQVRTYFTGGA